MADRNNPIHIPEDSDIVGLLREAIVSGETMEVVADGIVYSVSVVEQKPEGKRRPDTDKVRQLQEDIRVASGSWKYVDAEEFNAYIRERRKTANRPPVEL